VVVALSSLALNQQIIRDTFVTLAPASNYYAFNMRAVGTTYRVDIDDSVPVYMNIKDGPY